MAEKILVTGGTGYIGSHTIVDLIKHGFEPVSVDNGMNSDAEVLQAVEKITGVKVQHYPYDLCDLTLVRDIFEIHRDIVGVIHFAALKAVGESVEKPFWYFRNNINSLLNVLECATEAGLKAFIFSSSCTVYGEAKQSPVAEDTPLQEAASPYGRTKQMGEQIIQDTLSHQKLQAVLLRYFNPAGAHQSGILGESPRNTAQNLVPVITETAIGKRESFTVFGSDYPTRDGTCIRDYIHVCDLANAHTLALKYVLEGKQTTSVEIFNLGIGEGLTVMEVIQAFEKVSGLKLNYHMGGRRPGDVSAIFANYEKAKQMLGWQPGMGVEDIMKTAWEWEKFRTANA